MTDLTPYERKVYSQFEEDGITLELVRRIDPPKYFVEIGAGDGSENCTRILLEDGWSGVWVDKDPANFAKAEPLLGVGKKLHLICDRVTISNARGYIEYPKQIGVLSIDVDGNDYWLWKQICGGLFAYRPHIVIIEAQIQKPHDEPYVMPYDPDYEWDNVSHTCGASVLSLIDLGLEMDYIYVGKCSNIHSPNLFFVRSDLMEKVRT